ncbi:MAG: RNase adaptor protein RapZ, partial [Bifidobacteriaceae bacterium]|nr:RNase adaptor protein RapZ [Bifidobacteriaceae bacterium]
MEDSGAAVTEQAARPREILVITGLSGAGRTAAAGVLEDHGWYVVDNLPPRLIGAVVGMMT